MSGRRRSRSSAVAALIGVVLFVNAPAQAFTLKDLSPSGHYKLKRIDVSSEHVFDKDQVLSVMTTKERPWYEVWKPLPAFDTQAFSDDLTHIKRYYQARGYYDARVRYDLTLHKNQVIIHLNIQEAAPVTIASVETKIPATARSPQQLEKNFVLPLKRGEIFDQDRYQAAAESLLNLYTSHSYAQASVQRHAVVEMASHTVRVSYDVKPGLACVFGRTSLTGMRRVNPQLIREQLTYKPGEPFDSRKLKAARDAITALNLFDAVDVQEGNIPGDPAVVPITIAVHEGPKHSFSGGIGYNTQTQINAMLSWTDYNFIGGGRQFSITGIYSDVTSAFDVKLLQPRLFSPQSSLTLEVSQQQQTYQTYTGNISGFDPHLDYKFSAFLTGSIGWRFEYLKFNSVDPSVVRAIGEFRRDGILSGPVAGLSFDDTENLFNPQGGERAWLLGNISDRAFGADYHYWRLVGEARKYQLIGWQTVLAARVKFGLSDKLDNIRDVPLSERFYSGGEGSVRGYGLRRIGPLSASDDPLGGLSLVEGSVELRRPMFWKLNGVLFFDCGQVSTKSYDLRVDALQCGYGPAAGMDSPVGPINVYIGFPTQKPRSDSNWQFYFSIGQYF